MASLTTLFTTLLYQGILPGGTRLNHKLSREVRGLSQKDKLGQQWSKKEYLGGYTSYASLSDLQFRSPTFMQLAKLLQPHANKFAKALRWEMKGCRLEMNACWMNIMSEYTYHTLHLHPHSVLSGTYYVEVPKGSVKLRLEDPRMPLFMSAPASTDGLYHEVKPKPGEFVLFESWLRHEVPPHRSKKPRISISFNYALEDNQD